MQEIWTPSSGEIPWNDPSPLVVDEISRAKAVGPSVANRRKVCTVGRRGVSLAVIKTGVCGDESAKPKEYLSWEKVGHSKSEYILFSAVREKHMGEDPEMGKTERDVCLFHEDDNDQSAYPCPSHLIDRGGDELEDLMLLPCWVWFDMEAPEAFERDGLDTIATTEQHLRTLADQRFKASHQERSQPTPNSSTRVLALRKSKESSP